MTPLPLPLPTATTRPRSEADSIDILAILNTVWRGKLWIMLCAGLGLAAGWYEATRVAVPLFTASTQLALVIQNEQLVNLQSVITGVSGDEYSMNTEMEVIRSRDLISRLVDELDLMNDPEFNSLLAEPRPMSLLAMPRQALSALRRLIPTGSAPTPETSDVDPEELRREVISAVRGQISPEIGTWSYIFTISATSQDPEKSALMANTLARIYRDEQIRFKVEATDAAATWLSARVGELALELEDRQSAVAELRARNALVSTEGLQAVNAQAIALRQQLQTAQTLEQRAIDRLAAVRLAVTDDYATRVEAADDAQLDAIFAAMIADDSGAELRFDRRYDQIAAQVEAEAARATAQVAGLQTELNDLGAQFEQQSADLVGLQQFEREAEATRVLYETFLARLKETSVQQGVHQADSRILSEATPGYQIAPRRSAIMGTALLLGLILGAAIVVWREYMQNTYRTAEELERGTGFVVLGQIPRIRTRRRLDAITYLRNKPTSAATEAIRDLRTSILLSNTAHPPKTIMLTSSVPGEGKTTQSIALALNLAGLDKKVLLIEGDIRRLVFDVYFPRPGHQKGLLSVVSGKTTLAEAVFRPVDFGIDVLMGEKSLINAADVFSSDSFRGLMAEARQTYDYVIIDTPPVLVVPDARVIAQNVDAVVYIVNWDKTTRTQVEEGLKQFRSAKVQVTGLVLTQINPRGMRRYGLAGKYGAYSAYGRGYYNN